ncbi:ArnT family glycosyltransferase [Candidatus Leptofilum sp.]|uniref:ArnT family glycosyltransferase n=1 Tax=Candidatus Leptofilum sp. TaxID=3241576 RepID=UPI003B5C479D
MDGDNSSTNSTFRSNHFDLLLLIAAGTFILLSFYNLSGWLMDDDEGTDFYEVWQLQEGQQPGIDYVAEQQPLFLHLGKEIVNRFGRSPLALRVPATVQLLLGSFILVIVIRKVWGSKIALMSLILLLSSPTVFEQARLFRPDPMMMGWEMLGLSAAIMAVTQKKCLWWAFSGAFYGVSILWKLFGVFPIVGLIFFFGYNLWHYRNDTKELKAIVSDGIYFSIPFLVFSLGISLLLYSQMGFYYVEAFQNHLQSGESVTSLGILSRPLVFFVFLIIWWNPQFSFLFALPFFNRKRSNILAFAENKLLLFQMLSPIIFFFITRPLHFRYFLHIFPAMAILLALQVELTINFFKANLQQKWNTKLAYSIFLAITLGLFLQPGFSRLLLQQENDSTALASLIQERTKSTDIVISDYAGINFLANRASIYEASIIAGAQINAQLVTAALLMERIEETNAQMVLVHVEGGQPPPHQLINLVDYEQFREFLSTDFRLLTVFDRAGQQIEVYERK